MRIINWFLALMRGLNLPTEKLFINRRCIDFVRLEWTLTTKVSRGSKNHKDGCFQYSEEHLDFILVLCEQKDAV